MLFYYHKFFHINVKLHLFTREEGGRKNPIGNDYRADHLLSDDCVLTMGIIFFLNKEKEQMNTGEVTDAEVLLHVTTNSKPKILTLKKGDKWKVFEGKRCVGECEMIERITTEEELNDIEL